MLFGRRRFDPQPTAPAAVLLASAGAPFSKAAVRRARELAAGDPVAVLSILKIYGSTFGLPNPGLLPTRREREEQYANVSKAINSLERSGCTADGQIAATRSAGRTSARAGRGRGGRGGGHGRLRGERRAPGDRGQRDEHGAAPADRARRPRAGERGPVTCRCVTGVELQMRYGSMSDDP